MIACSHIFRRGVTILHNGYFKGCDNCIDRCCYLLGDDADGISVGLSSEDIARIKKISDKDDVFEKGNITGIMEIKPAANGHCPFVNEHGCTLGDARPLSCKVYPYLILKKRSIFYLARWIDECKTTDWDYENYEDIVEIFADKLMESWVDDWAINESRYVILCEVPAKYLGN